MYIEAPSYMEKMAGENLGEDTNLWLQKIRNAFDQQLMPLIRAGGKPYIKLTYKAFPSDAAVGGVTITIGGRIILFPIIIRDKILADFDTYYDQRDKTWHYLTDERMNSLSNEYSPYKGVTSTDIPEQQIEGVEEENVSWRRGAQSMMRTASLDLSNMAKIAEFLEEHPEELETLPPKIAEWCDLTGKAALRQADFRKEASLRRDNTMAPKFTNFDVALIHKKDLNTYNVKLSSYGHAKVEEKVMNHSEVSKLAYEFGKKGTKVLSDLDSTDRVISRGNESDSTGRYVSSHLDDARQYPGSIGSHGTYEVMLTSGVREVGVVYPLIEWAGGDTSGLYVWISPGNYSVARYMAGRRVSENMVLPRGPISGGTTGVFVKNSEGLTFSTQPIKIESIASSKEASMQIKATDIRHMTKLHLVITDAVKYPTRINPDLAPELIIHDRNNYYIPQDMFFSPLPPSDVSIISTPGGTEKLASDMIEYGHIGGVYEIHRKRGGLFSVYEKKACLNRKSEDDGIPSFTVTSGHMADFILKTAGINASMPLTNMVPGEEIKVQVPDTVRIRAGVAAFNKMAAAQTGNKVEEDVSRMDTHDIFKIARIMAGEPDMDISVFADQCEVPFVVKEALSGDKSTESLYKILNLNFLGKENVDYFVDNLNVMKDAEDVLTRLLVVSRMSELGISPTLLKNALEGITATREKFEKVRGVRLAR